MRSHYAAALVPNTKDSLTEAQFAAAIAAMERDRNRYLEAVRAYDRKCLRQKMRGHRQPRKAERESLRLAQNTIGGDG